MQTNDPYRAIRAIKSPGMMYDAYQPGDQVSQSAVDNWRLVVGEDVMPVRTDVVARPEDDAPRESWEAFAIGQGWTTGDARAASLADLRKVPAPDPEVAGEPLPDPSAPPERPGDDAVKAEWVAYAMASGADEEWATAKSTTKADLMDYEALGGPAVPGDPVEVAANEQANG